MRLIDRKIVLEDGSEYYGYGFGSSSCVARPMAVIWLSFIMGSPSSSLL